MKKSHILILSIICVFLTMSLVSAVENNTDVINNQNNDLISINENDNESISLSEEESVCASSENNSTILAVTNDSVIIGSYNNTEILTVSSENVLSSEITVTPLASSNYKTPTKNQRTFNIGSFKAILSQSQYKKLYKISGVEDMFFDYDYYEYYYVGEYFNGYYITSTGLYYSVKVKTNKFVNVKVKIGNKYYIKKTRAYMMFSYGGGQCGVPYRHMMYLTHNYANPGYDYAKVLGKSAKYFSKCKQNPSFTKLNKSKLYSLSYVYKKYSVY